MIVRHFENSPIFLRVSIDHTIWTAASEQFSAAPPGARPITRTRQKIDKFTLDGIDGGMVKAIADFCYTGHIDLNDQNVEKFRVIATKVGIDLLVEKCRQFVADKSSKNLSVSFFL